MESVFGSDYAAQFPSAILSPKEQPAKSAKPDMDIFETTDHVFVKVPISESQLEQLKIKHTSHALMIENFPNLDHPKK